MMTDMKLWRRHLVVVGTFLLIALFGLLLSLSAPYIKSGDETVYLVGALQTRDGNLPDARMLEGTQFGPYLYPKVLLWGQEALGPHTFKAVYLVVVLLATGLAAYTMFRLLYLPWIPALLMAVLVLLPRFASGLEIFGVLTFRDAIGRASAYPLFFLGAGFLIRRLIDGKSLWPVFGIFGLCMFLHPVTVMLFSFISLIAVGVTRLLERIPILKILRELVVAGLTFVLAGSYFFVEVFTRLARGVATEGVSTAEYVEALLFRNAFDFPAGSLQWYPHMAIVSAFFILVLIGFYVIPAMRSLRVKYLFPYEKEMFGWGLAVALGSLILSPLVPGINLYFMEHADAPYIFQQWSRVAKFYYLGLFVVLTPAVYVLWGWYQESRYRFKLGVLALLVLCGVLSSSFSFEVAQFAVGYKNFDRGYVPQALSHIPNDVTPEEYRETCQALERFGATPEAEVLSGDFALRYYCKANLYVTQEEGGAYQQLSRAELVAWYHRLLAQREAFTGADLEKIVAFAKSTESRFVVLPRVPAYTEIVLQPGVQAVTTARHFVVQID